MKLAITSLLIGNAVAFAPSLLGKGKYSYDK